MQKITPFLWFDSNAEEAINFYTSIFKDSKITSMSRWGKGGPVPEETLMSATFQLAGQEFMAMNAGPRYKFTEAISMFVKADTQEEIDYFWDKLVEGGTPQACGWLKDKFGLSWQIIPTVLGELMGDKDRAKAKNVMDAMLKMVKIDIDALKEAYAKKI